MTRLDIAMATAVLTVFSLFNGIYNGIYYGVLTLIVLAVCNCADHLKTIADEIKTKEGAE